MPDDMTFEEALDQLRRVAKRHEGPTEYKGLLHMIADALERERFVLPKDPKEVRKIMADGDWWKIALEYSRKEINAND
jgi:hypothetical protein